MFRILTKAMLLPSFLLSFKQAYVELRIRVKRHACFACVVESKTRSKKKQVINLDQDVVCGYFFSFWVDGVWTPCHEPSLSFLGCGLSFSLSFLSDMPCGHVAYLLWACILFFVTCFVSMWHTFFGYASFISFCIAHIPDGNFGERGSHGITWSFILW